MSTKSSQNKYSEEFRKTIVTLYQSGKTCSEIQKEYGISSSALSNQHSISILCRVLNVNRSTYYKYLNRKPSRRQRGNVGLKRKILELYARSDQRLGARKIRLCLLRDDCISISYKRHTPVLRDRSCNPPRFPV